MCLPLFKIKQTKNKKVKQINTQKYTRELFVNQITSCH